MTEWERPTALCMCRLCIVKRHTRRKTDSKRINHESTLILKAYRRLRTMGNKPVEAIRKVLEWIDAVDR